MINASASAQDGFGLATSLWAREMLTSKQAKWLGVIGSAASIVGLLMLFVPAEKRPEAPPQSRSVTASGMAVGGDVVGRDITINVAPTTPPPRPATDPQLRIQFHVLEGPTVLDRAIRGFGFSEREGFLSTPYWVKNEVFNDLVAVIKLFGLERAKDFPYDLMELTALSGSGRITAQKKIPPPFDASAPAASQSELRPFYGALRDDRTTRVDYGEGAAFSRPERLLSEFQSNSAWTIRPGRWFHMEDVKEGVIPFHAIEFFGFLPSSEVGFVRDPVSRRILSERTDVKDLVFFTASSTHGAFDNARIIPREIKMLVLDIENVGDSSLRLTGYERTLVSAKNAFELRRPAEVRGQERQSRVAEISVPLDTIQPKEHLFIPLSITLGFASELGSGNMGGSSIHEDSLPTRWWDALPYDPIKFEFVRGIDPSNRPITARYEVSKQFLASKLDFKALVERDYYLGHVVDVKSIAYQSSSGAKALYPVRRFDPDNLIIRGGDAKGSCPILYVMEDGKWRRLRPVIVDAATKTREATEHVPVARAQTRFSLREEEAESSYIDFIGMQIKLRGNKTIIIPESSSDLLAKRDGRYLVLRTGDQVDLRFDVPEGLYQDGEWALVITGYYVPDTLRSSR